MQWIRNAKINYKLIFMIVLPMLGLLYFSSNAIYEKVKELSELNRLQTLVTTEIYINDLIHEIQKSGAFYQVTLKIIRLRVNYSINVSLPKIRQVLFVSN